MKFLHRHLVILLTSASLAIAPDGFSQGLTTLEVVNDTGLPDSAVLFRVVGYPTNGQPTMTPTNFFTTIGETSPGKATMVPLSTLSTNNFLPPYQEVSTASGNTNTVYSMQINSIASGQIYFQYGGTPFVFTNGKTPGAGPAASNNFRYDYAEFTIFSTNAGYNAMDVTYVDKFGFPIKQEWYRGSALLNSGSTHLSTKALVDRFLALGLKPAVFGINTNGQLSPNVAFPTAASYTNFARIVAPHDMFPATAPSTFPYPSYSTYLNSLASNNIVYQMNGNSPHGGYYYVGYNVSLSNNVNAQQWEIQMQYSGTSPSNSISGSPYTNTLTVPIPYANASQWVAQSPSSAPYYINGVLADNSPTAAIEQWMMGDVQTALNTGFWGGLSSNSMNWYLQQAVIPPPAPFAGARAANDGFYNAFCSLLYSHTDFYGYTYGERFTPNVLYNPAPGDRLRLTILPDDRLNSPLVEFSGVTSNSITLNWQPIPGATGYQVTTLRPSGIPQTNVTTTNYTLTGLTPGWPYSFAVKALATAPNNNQLVSAARTVSTSTLGPVPTNAVTGNFTMIQMPIAMADNFGQILKVRFNGTDYPAPNFQSGGIPPRWVVDVGPQAYPIAVYDKNTNVVFSDWISFDVAPPTVLTNVTMNGTNSVTNFVTVSSMSNVQMNGITTPFPAPQNLVTDSNAPGKFVVSTGPAPVAQITFNYALDGSFRPSPAAVPAGSNYTGWIAQYYTTSPQDFPDSDPDGDTTANVMEYFQSRNPSVSDVQDAQSVVLNANTNTNTLLTNFGSVDYSFRKGSNAPELVQVLQWAPNSTVSMSGPGSAWNWTNSSLSFLTNAPGGAGYFTPTYRLSPLTTSNAIFKVQAILP